MYTRMPMGIADPPSWFCDMTGRALHDLTTKIQLETFVDDNALAGNEFTDVLRWLQMFLERCRERNLSISQQKTRLFVQETVFGGSRVGKDGIKPVVTKLEAVAKWPAPLNLLDLMRFLGLTGYFRSLIQNYACIAAPLTDLQCNLDLSQPEQRKGNRRYRQFLRDCTLVQYWTAKHTKAFTKLKNVLLEEPILRASKFDGTSFILITDGSKDGFGAVLTHASPLTSPTGRLKPSHTPSGTRPNELPQWKNDTNPTYSSSLH